MKILQAPIQNIPIQNNQNLKLDIKRLDLIHPHISGNKFFKLKYNLEHTISNKYEGVISFGGAYSNHIHALSFACKYYNLKSIAIIRGHELANKPLNPSLDDTVRNGTILKFITRQQYQNRNSSSFIQQLQKEYPNYYILPEGACNDLAKQGCKEIISTQDLENYDYICLAIATGGTMAGIIQHSQTKVLGFSALKDNYLSSFMEQQSQHKNWHIFYEYCFGGYAKSKPELIQFIQDFEQKYQIPIEPIYTGKMLYGVFDLVAKNYFPKNSKILTIHTGGLQARDSFYAKITSKEIQKKIL